LSLRIELDASLNIQIARQSLQGHDGGEKTCGDDRENTNQIQKVVHFRDDPNDQYKNNS